MPPLATLLRRFVKAPWFKETLLAVPRIALLVTKLLTDERVPKRTKLALAGCSMKGDVKRKSSPADRLR
jgi:hypothetical protein